MKLHKDLICRFVFIIFCSIVLVPSISCDRDGGGGGNNNISTTTVVGTILDIKGNPIENAEVTIFSEPVTVYTDGDGNFLAEVEVGDHTLVIKKDSTEIYRKSITCIENSPLFLGDIVTQYNPGDDTGGANEEGKSKCDFNEGVSMLWDWLNHTVPPLDEIPSPGFGWQNYTHPTYPPLSFLYPPDWEPTTIADQQNIGVELFRNDGAAILQYLFVFDSSGTMTVDEWLDNNVNYILDLIGENGSISLHCSMQDEATPATGVMVTAKAIAITAGQTTMVATAGITVSSGVPLAQIYLETMAGPSSEYTSLTEEVFLPIIVQMLYGNIVVEDDEDDDDKDD